MEEEKTLMVLRRSRKSYSIEYACGLFLIVLLLILFARGALVAKSIVYVVIGIAAIALISAEIARLFTSYTITDKKVIITKGFIKQQTKSIHFIPLGFVPEINLKQGRIQRLLDVGTVFIHSSGENSFEIKDVDEPQRILELIEELIEKNRRGGMMATKE